MVQLLNLANLPVVRYVNQHNLERTTDNQIPAESVNSMRRADSIKEDRPGSVPKSSFLVRPGTVSNTIVQEQLEYNPSNQ